MEYEYIKPGQSRFIPARAGNGGNGSGPPCPRAVHPRARGERVPIDAAAGSRAGSSPRARGTGQFILSWHWCSRFIPARAGNGPALVAAGCPSPVHPRARGERLMSRNHSPRTNGSSPRARGTDERRPLPDAFCRFIPARAGNGGSRQANSARAAVHPRARGERGHQRCPQPSERGSSPRARGTGPPQTKHERP